jgi:hypothetical protein
MEPKKFKETIWSITFVVNTSCVAFLIALTAFLFVADLN